MNQMKQNLPRRRPLSRPRRANIGTIDSPLVAPCRISFSLMRNDNGHKGLMPIVMLVHHRPRSSRTSILPLAQPWPAQTPLSTLLSHPSNPTRNDRRGVMERQRLWSCGWMFRSASESSDQPEVLHRSSRGAGIGGCRAACGHQLRQRRRPVVLLGHRGSGSPLRLLCR